MSLNQVTIMDMIEPTTVSSLSGLARKQTVDPSVASEFANLVNGSAPTISTITKTEINPSIYSVSNNIPLTEDRTQTAPVVTSSEKPASLPSLLGIINSTSEDYQSKISSVKQNIAEAFKEDGKMSNAKMLETQVLLVETSALSAYFSKVAGSLSNAINTIVKTQ